jgi:hypothetical protein
VPATTLDQRKDRVLVSRSGLHLATGLAANVSLVGLDDPAARTHKARFGSHGVANAVGHEPGRLIGHAKHAMKVVAADAFLRRTQQVDCNKPLRERNLAALKHGPHGHGELLPAVPAEPQARAMRLAVQFAVALRAAAVGACRALRPSDAFKIFPGSGFVTEASGVHENL